MADDTFTIESRANEERAAQEAEEAAKEAKEAADVRAKESQEATEAEKGKDGEEEQAVLNEKITEGITKALTNMSLSDLLKHPVLGPMLNSWSDKAGTAQVTSAVTQAKGSWEEEASLKVLQERFENMSEEELGRALKEPEAAEAFASLIAQRNKVAEEASEEAVSRKGQVYGYAVQVGVYTDMLEKSGLSVEKKAELKPENFTHLGSKGIIAWGSAVQEALLEQASDEKSRKLLDEKWEAHLEEREGGDKGGGSTRDRTDVSSGRTRGPITAKMLGSMTAQEVMLVPQEQITQALKEQAATSLKK